MFFLSYMQTLLIKEQRMRWHQKLINSAVCQNSTFLVIRFTKLAKIAKLTNVHLSVLLHIFHQDVRCKKYIGMNCINKVHSKTWSQKRLEHTLFHKLLSGVQLQIGWIFVCLVRLVNLVKSEFPKTSNVLILCSISLSYLNSYAS